MHFVRLPGASPLREGFDPVMWIALICTALMAACAGRPPEGEPLATVEHVDLDRYAGRWYEVAKIPNRFQDQCVSDTTAHYTPNADGTIAVVNRCRLRDGSFDEADAVARVADPETQAKLEVSFFSLLGWRPLWGNYWVLALGREYEYSVVGEPGRRYGWILSRTPTLPDTTRAEIDRRLRDLGYVPERFEASAHAGE
jgi:apolipoprotein D and lipocalin family protein